MSPLGMIMLAIVSTFSGCVIRSFGGRKCARNASELRRNVRAMLYSLEA